MLEKSKLIKKHSMCLMNSKKKYDDRIEKSQGIAYT